MIVAHAFGTADGWAIVVLLAVGVLLGALGEVGDKLSEWNRRRNRQ